MTDDLFPSDSIIEKKAATFFFLNLYKIYKRHNPRGICILFTLKYEGPPTRTVDNGRERARK